MFIINMLGVVFIALIVWWFWLYRPNAVVLGPNDLIISVENGIYSPSHIKLPVATAVEIRFIRRDQSPCSESLLIPDLDISESLPFNKLKSIHLPPMPAGE